MVRLLEDLLWGGPSSPKKLFVIGSFRKSLITDRWQAEGFGKKTGYQERAGRRVVLFHTGSKPGRDLPPPTFPHIAALPWHLGSALSLGHPVQFYHKPHP